MKWAVHGHACHVGLFARHLFVGQHIPLAGVAHQNGTICFGIDPKTSALDVNCQAHDVDNLYVVDASFFPCSGAVHPALTIMANALWVGGHRRERLAYESVQVNRRVFTTHGRIQSWPARWNEVEPQGQRARS